MKDVTVVDMMRAYAEDAVELASQLNVVLDFSDESIGLLDQLLEQYHRGIPRGIKKLFAKGPSPEQITQMTKIWGGYLGETIIRQLGGHWMMSETFDNALAVKVGRGEAYPLAKVNKRILNGPEDSVISFYTVLKQGILAKKE